MTIPGQDELPARLRALPAAVPLLRRIGDEHDVYVVGGAVRDLLLGGEPVDLDLVVEGDPARVLARLDGEVVVHDRFGTSTAIVDGFSYDLARARSETYARPGALPDVSPATLEEDLRRRDFTVNTIALPLEAAPAALRAFPGALEDLEHRLLRVLHEDSFADDPTRLLRLARYRGRLGFEIEDRTRELVREAVERRALETVSGPRIGNELRLLVREQDPIASLLALRELALDSAIDPRFGLEDDALARRAFALLPPDGSREVLALALAARDLSDGELRGLLDRLGFEAGAREAVVAAATRADALAGELAAAARPSEIARAARLAPPELVALAGALGPQQSARSWLEDLRQVALQIGGDDLLAAGVPPGPAVGRGLAAALEARIDGRASTREEQLAVALEAARAGG